MLEEKKTKQKTTPFCFNLRQRSLNKLIRLFLNLFMCLFTCVFILRLNLKYLRLTSNLLSSRGWPWTPGPPISIFLSSAEKTGVCYRVKDEVLINLYPKGACSSVYISWTWLQVLNVGWFLAPLWGWRTRCLPSPFSFTSLNIGLGKWCLKVWPCHPECFDWRFL